MDLVSTGGLSPYIHPYVEEEMLVLGCGALLQKLPRDRIKGLKLNEKGLCIAPTAREHRANRYSYNHDQSNERGSGYERRDDPSDPACPADRK